MGIKIFPHRTTEENPVFLQNNWQPGAELIHANFRYVNVVNKDLTAIDLDNAEERVY